MRRVIGTGEAPKAREIENHYMRNTSIYQSNRPISVAVELPACMNANRRLCHLWDPPPQSRPYDSPPSDREPGERVAKRLAVCDDDHSRTDMALDHEQDFLGIGHRSMSAYVESIALQ